MTHWSYPFTDRDVHEVQKQKNEKKSTKRIGNQLKLCALKVHRMDMWHISFVLRYICSCQDWYLCVKCFILLPSKIYSSFSSIHDLAYEKDCLMKYLVSRNKVQNSIWWSSSIMNILLLISIPLKYITFDTPVKKWTQQWGNNTRQFYDYFYSLSFHLHIDRYNE